MAIGYSHGPEAMQVLGELCRRSPVLFLSGRLSEAEKNQRGGGQQVSIITRRELAPMVEKAEPLCLHRKGRKDPRTQGPKKLKRWSPKGETGR